MNGKSGVTCHQPGCKTWIVVYIEIYRYHECDSEKSMYPTLLWGMNAMPFIPIF
jgi:hypothetical protein